MNYKVLYRKYRPDNFDNLVGQNAIVEILKNSIKENKIAHAYIFSGPRGTGKTSTARILAKSVNCLNNKDGIACDECENCLSFNNSPDIIEIDAASNNGVDEIRELINNVKIMPTKLKYKIYIIDEVHMLTTSAFNALLLTLEEPPEHVIFILATTNLESIPVTIISRCQKFDFKRITKKDIFERLKYVCDNEKILYDEEALNEIAILSEGGLRDALSMLDQLSKNQEKIDIDLVSREIGTITNQKINELIDYIDKSDVENTENFMKEMRNLNLNYKVFIKKLIDELANRAINYLKNISKTNLTYDDYKNMINELNELINKINISIDPYTLIEINILNYIKNKPVALNNLEVKESITDNKSKEQNEKIEINEEIKEVKKVIKKESLNYDKFINIRLNNCFALASKDNLNEIKLNWNEFTEQITDQDIKGLMIDTSPAMASKDYLILVTNIKHNVNTINERHEKIENLIEKIINKKMKIACINNENWQEAKSDYIKKIKSNYKYEIIEEEKEIEKEIKELKEEKNENDIEKIANNIFDKNKIEIE